TFVFPSEAQFVLEEEYPASEKLLSELSNFSIRFTKEKTKQQNKKNPLLYLFLLAICFLSPAVIVSLSFFMGVEFLKNGKNLLERGELSSAAASSQTAHRAFLIGELFSRIVVSQSELVGMEKSANGLMQNMSSLN